MSVRVTSVEGKCALYDSTTELAFGPVFNNDDEAEDFLQHLRDTVERDPRIIPALQLANLYQEWKEDQ